MKPHWIFTSSMFHKWLIRDKSTIVLLQSTAKSYKSLILWTRGFKSKYPSFEL